MNNSKLIVDYVPLNLEEPLNLQPQLREREEKLERVLQALKKVQASKEWSSLKTELFDGLTETIEKLISHEAKKEIPDGLKLRYLAGQFKWAERYSDLSRLEQEFRAELLSVRTKLHG